MIRRLHPCFSAGWSRFFFVPVCGENGDYGRKIRKIIPYYGNTMDCACVELRTFAA